jgi:formylmethanofuran dehydrogenase subunit E
MSLATRPGTDELSACLDGLRRLHPRLCPRQVLGVRIGLLAGTLLEAHLPRGDKRLLAIVETDGCFADGVSIATGCWLGRRTLRLMDYGRVAATVVDTATWQAIRVRPRSDVRRRALDWAPEAADRWSAQLAGYQLMSDADLLEVQSVTLTLDMLELVGDPVARVICVRCGEEVLNRREVPSLSGPMCRACTTGPYYAARAPGAERA